LLSPLLVYMKQTQKQGLPRLTFAGEADYDKIW
jgi:hypothetical protein